MSLIAFLKALFFGWALGFVAAIPAGPVGAAVFAQGIEGRKNTTPAFILGAILVDAIYCGLAFLGVTVYLKPLVSNPLVGAVAMLVMLVLGYRMATKLPVFDAEVGILTEPAERDSAWGAFVTGFFMCVANPILPLSWAALVLVMRDWVGDGWAILIGFAMMAALGMGTWLLVLHRIARFGKAFLTPNAVQWVIRGLGILVMGTGVYYGGWTVVKWFG